MAGEAILIIDDNPDVRILLGERVLPSYGYRTLMATDGQEGLWQIRTQKPDLILLDLRLPDMTGLDLLHILSSEGYDTPVILITAYGSELIAAQALRLGVRDYIIKPFTLDEIVESVERALTEHRLRRERNALTDHLQRYTDVLQALADVGTEATRHEDVSLHLRHFLEMAVKFSQARAGRIWVYQADDDALYLRVAQDRADQQPHILYQRDDAPRIMEALSSGQLVQWREQVGDDSAEMRLAFPVLLDNQPAAVLEVHFPEESLPQGDPGRLILQTIANWMGVVLHRSQLGELARLLQGQIEAMGSLSQDLLLVLDADDRVIAATPASKTMLGWGREEVIGQEFHEWIRQIESPYGDLVQWYRGQPVSKEGSERYTMLFRDPEGDSRQAEVQVFSQRETNGALRRYLLFQEVTTQRRLEQQVRHLRHMLGESERSTQIGLLLTDLRGAIKSANNVAVDLLGHPLDELLGRPIWEVLGTAEGTHLLPEEIARAHREGWSFVEIHTPQEGVEVLGITTLLLVGDEGDPQEIVVLARPAQSLLPDSSVESTIDESDILGSSGVNSDARS